MCPFLVERNYQRQIIINTAPSTPAAEKFASGASLDSSSTTANSYIGMGAGPVALQLAVDIFAVIADLADLLRMHCLVDAIVVLLAEFSATLRVCVCFICYVLLLLLLLLLLR